MLVPRILAVVAVTALFAAAVARSSAGESAAAAGKAAEAATAASRAADAAVLPGDWPLERITLFDGKTYQGLVESESASSIEFTEVRRPRGKPMFLVVRPIDRKAIAHWERLPRDEQEQLRSRLMRYKNRALVEGRRMEDLAITPSRRDGRLVWNYQGSLFTVESTADEAMTRRLIVRLGQIFTAYRQLFPPRWTAGGRVHIRIFGATAEYHAALAELGLDIKNPAVFLVDKNVILAGSELNRFDAELEAVNRQHRQIKQQLDALVADMPARLKELGETLTKNGVPAGERQKIVAAEQRKWEDQRKAARKKIVVLDRKNAARFDEVAGQMFKRLAHEAFHAYLEVHVYPPGVRRAAVAERRAGADVRDGAARGRHAADRRAQPGGAGRAAKGSALRRAARIVRAARCRQRHVPVGPRHGRRRLRGCITIRGGWPGTWLSSRACSARRRSTPT